MKREDLKKLLGDAATDEVLDSIMGMNGADIESHKKTATDLQTQLDATNNQLTEANKQIEGFKGMKVEDIQKAADDYKAQFEKAQTDHAAEMENLKFNHVLESALTS